LFDDEDGDLTTSLRCGQDEKGGILASVASKLHIK